MGIDQGNRGARMRSILHIDMNAFFASVEQRSDPSLRGKPVAVAGSERRGVILSPSYEARAFGVKTGMQYHEAKRLCPEITFVPASPGKYSHACRQLITIWERFTPLVELFSIDEAFLDVTGCEPLMGDPVQVAVRLKNEIWEIMGLTCSVGIAQNKLLAKLGSDMLKPDGIVLISPDDEREVLEDLPVKEICGIGPSMTRQLAAMGIHTCGELGRAPLTKLSERFGILGERLRDMGKGIDDDPVISRDVQDEEDSKSVGHSMTLEQDCDDSTIIQRHLLQLCEKVGRRMRRGGYTGRTVSLTIRYADFHTFSRQQRLPRSVDHGLDIYAVASSILTKISLDQAIRLVGVSVSSLEKQMSQVPLFMEERKRKFTTEAMDDINDRYGDFTVTWGTLAERYRHERVISPAWRPGGDREY